MRSSRDGNRTLVCIANLSPVPREGYRVGLPQGGDWAELLNTDSTFYAGSGLGNMGKVTAEERGWHDQPFSATVTLPPLAVVWLRPAR
jgi:1,4-alpha-glucan branching enzyme